MNFSTKNDRNMDKIHRNSLVAALCAAFLFLMSFSSFGQMVTTIAVDEGDLTSTSAILKGHFENNEGIAVTSYGFKYSDNAMSLSNDLPADYTGDPFTATLTGLTPGTTYYYRAYVYTDAQGQINGSVESFTTPTGSSTTYQYVDLGLPSGIKWANMNIGATQPSDFGNRYAWGETTPKDVNSYSWENYIHCAGTNNDLTKYCFSSIWGHNGYTDELTTLEATDDAATVNWGEGWRMPTDEECQELYNNCYASWDTQNGVVGVTLTSRSNGNSIFIPIDPEENNGTHYWSSSFGTDDDDPTMGKTLYLNASNQIVSSGGDQRNRPNAIRPVYAPSNTASSNNTFTDDRDGQTYKFVTIGNQIWMAENLRYNNNLTVDTEGETSDTDPYIYYPDGNVANFGTYGYLYNWPAAMNGESASEANPSGVQGICPSGWHLPSNAEWTQLKDYLGEEHSGAKLAGRTELWDSDAGESSYLITESEYFGTSGFNALPAGERRGTSYFDINRLASFWTATEDNDYGIYASQRDIHNYVYNIYDDNSDKSWARSIRCVKNVETVFQGNFEDADENANWTLSNGTQTNQWHIGTAINNGGNYGLYISSDGGASNGYDYTSPSNVYAYHTLEISETADYNISFDWRTKASYLVAFLAPLSSSQQPVGGTLLTDTPDDWTLIGSFSNGDSWQSFSKRLYISEGDYYFILYWTNNENDGNNPPPAAVDNIVINKAPQVITDTFVDARDGQSYSYVNIGSQTWMSENLRFVGDIPLGTETSETVAYRYIPNGDNANVATYGYLYNWPAAMNGESSSDATPSGVQGICPNGWHLPSEQEWAQLYNYLGGSQNASGPMLAGRSDLWDNGVLTQSQNFGTTGFNALPAGNYGISYQDFGSVAQFWTTTNLTSSEAYYKQIRSNYTDIYSDAQGKDFGNSVRCVKNAYPTADNYQCGFDDDAEFANWTIQGINSGQPNYWTIGMTEQGEANLNSLFITTEGGGYSYTNSSTSAVYAYCRLEFPERLNYNIAFDWQCDGESTYDYLRAFLVPTSANPDFSAGTEIANGHTETPDGWIDINNGRMNQAGREWMHADKTMIIEPGLYYLVFYWRNDDGAGDNPPAAVDNIRIVKITCPSVTNIAASDITIESATLTWTEIGSAESWDIIVSETELSDTDLETYNNFTTVSSPSYSATGLEQAHTYYVYVRAACSSDEKSEWASGVFSSAFCTAVDMCSIRYELEDSYGDGWNGNTLNVVDASTDEVLASWTIEDGSSASGTLAVCDGRDIRFEYVGDNYPDETSYRVYDVNDELIFEGSDKFTDPIHYMMSCSSCLSVNNLMATGVNDESATISWGDRNSTGTWEFIVSDQNLSGPELDGATVQTLTDSTYSLSGLTPTTIYYVYVRSVCSAEEKSGWKSLTFRTTQVPAQIPYSYGFEDESENAIWTLNVGASNGWSVGEAAYNDGSKGLYVSNDNGASNSYDTGSETSIYAYRTLNVPELCYYSVSFDWMAKGESGYDYLRAFIVPTSLNADLSSGIQNGIDISSTPANWIELYSNGGQMNGSDSWQTNSIEVALEQGLYNLVFYWRNDNSGGEIPPAAIDNISVTKLVPFRLSALVQPGWGSTAVTLEGHIDFLGDVQTLTAGFELGVNDANLADSVGVVSSDGTFSHEFTGLEAQTTYYYRGFVIYNDEPIYTDIAQFKTRNNDNGTESSPLIIESESDWGEFVTAIQNGAGFGADAMGEYKGSEIVDGAFGMYFKIGNDITLTSSNITVNGFKGILLGDGKTITLDNAAGYGADFRGLFSSIYNATIDSLNISLAQSITIPSPETSDNNGFGLLCSEVYSSSVISDCTISGGEGILLNCNEVRFGAGALVGSVNDATITNCTNNLDVDGYYVAGIAGLMKGGTISKCTNNAAIKSETEGYYVGGIVYSIEGNVQSTITECLNTGALTSGGIAGGIVARINGSNSTISKCMNIGQITTNYTDWSTGEYAGGIVGGSRMSSTITNNANYGSFGRLSSNIGGIAGSNMTSLSKNVSAPVYLSENIAGNSSYNIFATMSVGVDNYETANEEDDDFFDEQIGDIKVDSLRLRFASHATAMPTSDMVGSALSSSLSSENWIFTNGLYPMPAGIPESPKTTVARIPMYLAENETVFGVMSNFTVPTIISGQTVEWTSSSPDVIAISDGSATVTRPASGEADVDVTLTATCQGETKSFIVRVIGPKQVPVLTEGETAGTSVILNGEFGSEAEGIITYTKEYGFKYGKESDLSDAVNIVSTNLGTNLHESTRFTAVINNFDDSKYYYAAYATTADATTLGEIKSFKKSTAPEVIAKYPMWRTNSEATIEFDITLNDGEEFYGVESAFHYGTERTNLNLTGIINYDDDYGYYSTDLSNLTADTKYYYMAEVSNDLGTTRSDTLEFLTCGTMTDSRDDTQYYTIRIGNQTWMAQNLKYAGNIPQGSETSSTDAYRYNPDDFSDAVDEYGYLYNWAAAMNGENPTNENPSSVQGICPSGWHLPSDAEWTQLTDYLGGTGNAGVMLAGQPAAQDRYWQTSDMTMSVTFGKSGFNALPAGYYVGTNYSSFGSGTGFWSATENTSEYAYVRSIYYESTSMDRNYDNKVKGNSVRCVKGSVVYAYDTLPYCGESYTYHDTVITASGDYTVRIQNGETENIYKLHLTLYPALVPTISSYSNGCYGENNGYVEVGATGGAGDYSYAWSTPDMQTTARINNLTDGEYSVVITDVAGCSATISQTIVTPGELTVTVSGNNPDCYGDETTLSASANGGTPDYTYAWNSGESNVSITVSPTATTTYTVTITDANNCTATASKNIVVGEQLTVSISGDTQVQCYGDLTASLTATANGGSMAMGYTYAWSNSQSGQIISTLGAGNYSVTVTDGNGCNATSSVTVTGPDAALSIDISATNNTLTCSNLSATITATVTGGTEGYTYNWSNSGTNNTSEVTAPGSYTVTVTDANGCSIEATQTITEDKTAPTVTIDNNATELNCNRTSITLTATGSDASYVWSNGETNAATTVTTPDTYTVTATGDNGCTNETSVTITKVENPTVDVTASEILCYGATTTFTANVSDGAAPYSYSWQDDLGSGQTLEAQAGTYAVTVTDNNGCTASANGTASQPTQLTASITDTDFTLTCSNMSVTLTASVTGGTSGYTYNWSNNESNGSLVVTEQGTYVVTVTDANGCTTMASQAVNQDVAVPTVSISSDATELNCNRTSIALTASAEGTGATYQWSNGVNNAATTVTTPGTYTVTATGTNGCTSDASTTITQVDNPTVSVSASEIQCYGESTTFTANANGGAAPYSYSWQDDLGSGQTLEAQAGTYAVTVTDNNGCTASANGTASQPTQLTASITDTDFTLTCSNMSVTLTASVTGGTSGYTYNWSNNESNGSLVVTEPGTYVVTVTDANGCTTMASQSVMQDVAVPTVSISSDATELNCHRTSITLTASAEGTGVTYQWSNGGNTAVNNVTAPATYTITATGSNGCTSDASTTITQVDNPTVSVTSSEIQCYGESTTFTANANGGAAPYSYSWQDDLGSGQTLEAQAGTYAVTVTDNNGCTASANGTASQPTQLTASISNPTNVSCNGASDGTATVIVSGGTTDYTYLWSNNATTPTVNGLAAGIYNITITDANSCTATASTTITQPDALAVTISGSTSVCEGTTTTLTANVQGGTADFTYSWSNGETTNAITTPQLTVATEYSVTVTDANDCTVSTNVNVEIGDTPGIEISQVSAICIGNEVMLQANVSNAGSDYTVQWSSSDTGAGLPDITSTETITVTPTAAGIYTYTASLTATSCSDGQPFNSSANVQLTVNELPDAAITNNTNETIITCSTTEISLTATGGTNYVWSNGVETADNNITAAGIYTVTVTDDNGCSSTTNITLTQNIEAPTVSINNITGTTLLTCTITAIEVEATGTGTAYQWSNNVNTVANSFTEAGTYTVTATADNGCTSTSAIEITPNADAPTVSITNNTGETELTCALTSISVTAEGSGTSYLWSNGANTAENTLTAPGTYTVTATAGNGCTASDQIIITQDIEAPEIIASATDSTICQGASTTISAIGGNSYTWSPETGLPTTVGASIEATPSATTTYTVTSIGSNGCMGSGEVTITVNMPTSSEFDYTACDSYVWNGTTYDQSGDFQQTFINANGCDSVVTLHLTINHSSTGIDEQTACDSYEWIDGVTYTESTDVPTFTLSNAEGCDSVVTLHLTINHSNTGIDEQTACDSYEWIDGVTYTESTDAPTFTLTNVNGCDSVVTLHLTINNSTTGIDTQVACDSYTWIDGVTYTESTDDPTFTLTNANGCDSVVTLHLTINNSTTGEFSDMMCSGIPYIYEGQTFTQAGTYEVQLTNAHGCDSIVTLTLTYSDNCSGTVSGIITDANTNLAIQNAKVTIGNMVTWTNVDGEYSLTILRGRRTIRATANGYASYSGTIDIQQDTTINIAIYSPQIHTSTDNITLTTYPYLEQRDTLTISNTGNSTLVWSSVTECDNIELLPEDENEHQRANTRALWDSIQTFTTQFNAEQAIATDGFFIYTSSWQRPGEFNRYTPDGEYIETFLIENVGNIRNLSYDGTYFYGTEATNIIFKLDLDNQTLVDSIETDIADIRHCSFDKQNGNLLAGSWNSLYRIDTASGTSTQIRSDLANVYSSAFDNLSPGGPYLWLFSQTSQNNGPSAYIRQFDINANNYTGKKHYLDDINLGNSSLAGGICASEYIVNGKYVLLANVQNPSGNNIVATYEIGRTNTAITADAKSGSIMPNENVNIPVHGIATEAGNFSATIRYRAAVMGNQSNDINVTISAVAPECNAVQQITAVTDTFHTVQLNWDAVELGNYNNVSYLIYDGNSTFAIDTVNGTSIIYNDLDVGEHCFHVRALSVAEYQCLSESSDTVCAEIQAIPCNISLTAETESDGESIFISWNSPIGVDHFSIRRNDHNNAEVIYTNEYVDSNVVPETEYCYTIIAYFENNACDEITAIVCSRIASGVCSEAPELTATAMSNSVVLNWTGSSDALAYKVYRNDVKIGVTTDTSYFDNVAFGLEYCYRIERMCEYGMYVSSDDVCVFIEANDENAVDEWSADKLSVYPNPTYGQFFIEGSQIATIQIYNAAGQTVYETDSNDDERVTINCENWTPGLYNIRIVSVEGQMATKRVTIFR